MYKSNFRFKQEGERLDDTITPPLEYQGTVYFDEMKVTQDLFERAFDYRNPNGDKDSLKLLKQCVTRWELPQVRLEGKGSDIERLLRYEGAKYSVLVALESMVQDLANKHASR